MANFILIENYIYLYHLDEFLILPTYPETVTDTLNSNFIENNALARSAPVFSYSYSGPRTINISLELHRDMLDGVNKNVRGLKIDNIEDDYLDSLINKIQAAALPVYNSANKEVVPPMVAVRFGNEIFIKGVIKGSISLTYKKPLIWVNGKEKYAQCTISFTVSEVDPYDARTVAQKGSFRGITRANDIYK